MAFFGLFGTAPGAYANASLSDKLALLGASLDQRDPDALARTQAGIQSRLQQAQADKLTEAQLGGNPGLDDDLAKIGIGGGPSQSLASLFARAQGAAMGGALCWEPLRLERGELAAVAGWRPMDADGNVDADAAAAAHHAMQAAGVAPQGMMGSGAPRTGVPDAGALMRLAGIGSLNPRLAAQAAVLEKQAQFFKPNLVEGSDGTYRNLNDPATAGVKSLPKDGNGFTYVADATAPGGYRAVPTAGYSQIDGDTKFAEAKAQATAQAQVGTAPAPGWQLGPNGWVDPGGTATAGVTATETAKNQARAATTPATWVDGSGATHYGSQADAIGSGTAGAPLVPTPAGSKRPSASFNLPGAAGADSGHVGPGDAAKSYMAATGGDLAKALDGYRSNLPAITQRGAALAEMARLNQAGVGQGGLNPAGMEVSNALASFGLPNQKLNNAQAFKALGGTLIKGITSGTGVQVRNQREFNAFMAQNPGLENTTAGRTRIINYLAANNALDNKEAQAATMFASRAGPSGLAGTVSIKGKPYTWDQFRQELYARNPIHY